MNIENQTITVSGLTVDIVRKDIKNLHLGVYPPGGRVRVAVPLRFSNEAARLAVVGKLGWIRRQQSGFEKQSRESIREMVDGESHYYLGNRYRLRLNICDEARPAIHIRNKTRLELTVSSSADAPARRKILAKWYRSELKALLGPLVLKWERRLGVKSSSWAVKKMKTKWGSCNPDLGKVWFNLELAKKSLDCLEYVVAHELAHLIVRHHDDRFVAVMNKHMPKWRSLKSELNVLPLAHELWSS